MGSRAFTNINWDATYNATKELLKGYTNLQMTAARYDVWIKSPVITDLPIAHGVNNANEVKLTMGLEEAETAKFDLQLINNTIDCIGSIDDRHRLLADLLTYRYIDGLRTKDVRKKLASECDYKAIFPERTYSDLLKDACWSFAMVYPRSDIRIKVRR